MSSSESCPNCGSIYGNEPRKIPCGHIVCHKCCLELYDKDNNTLVCPSCDTVHTFKSKNIFKKSLQQVAHSGFGKKTAVREMSFASAMPMEKASGAEKSVSKEIKKAAINIPTAPPGAPPEAPPTTTSPSPPLPLTQSTGVISRSSTPMPLMATKPTLIDNTLTMTKGPPQSSTNNTPPSFLSTKAKPPLSVTDVVNARCHSCAEICQVIVCDHCDHFVCLKCAEKHQQTTTTTTAQDLTNKWQKCKSRYNSLLQKLNRYNRDRIQIESDLSAIRVAVEQRSRDAIQNIIEQRDILLNQIGEQLKNEQSLNSIKHIDLINEFRQIQKRIDSALNGEDIGLYSQDDFIRDIQQLYVRMTERHNFIERHILKIPTVSQYKRVSAEKLLGELHFNSHMIGSIPNRNISPIGDSQNVIKQSSLASDFSKFTSTTTSNPSPRISSPIINFDVSTTNDAAKPADLSNIKPLMADVCTNGTLDAFEEFRRMAAQIHQQFNAPYSKVINAAPSLPLSTTDSSHGAAGTEKNSKKILPKSKPKVPANSSFTLQWEAKHCVVPNLLCMTPLPTPKLFILDKFGKVSVCLIPPKTAKPFDFYSLFPSGSDERIESATASTRFLIVYSRKEKASGTIYFFNHECKPVLQNGIYQNIAVHHIVCDQNAERLYCLDRMRCTIFYYRLPNHPNDIETCLKERHDFTQFNLTNNNYLAAKLVQNDDLLGFYERNNSAIHLYSKTTTEKVDEFKCEHFLDKYESWGIIAIRKDNNSLIFKVDELGDHEAINRQHVVYEVNRVTKQVIAQIQLNAVFGMIIGPNNEVILGIRQAKDSGIIQSYMRK